MSFNLIDAYEGYKKPHVETPAKSEFSKYLDDWGYANHLGTIHKKVHIVSHDTTKFALKDVDEFYSYHKPDIKPLTGDEGANETPQSIPLEAPPVKLSAVTPETPNKSQTIVDNALQQNNHSIVSVVRNQVKRVGKAIGLIPESPETPARGRSRTPRTPKINQLFSRTPPTLQTSPAIFQPYASPTQTLPPSSIRPSRNPSEPPKQKTTAGVGPRPPRRTLRQIVARSTPPLAQRPQDPERFQAPSKAVTTAVELPKGLSWNEFQTKLKGTTREDLSRLWNIYKR